MLTIVYVDDRYAVLVARRELVRREVMNQALDQGFGDAGKLFDLVPKRIVVENRDDLVGGFTVVDHLDASDEARAQQNLGARDGPFADDADVERISIGSIDVFGRKYSNPHRAVRARDESVERRRLRRAALRAIETQIPGRFIDLVLHGVERSDLDISVDDLGSLVARLEAVPRMRAKTVERRGRHRHALRPSRAVCRPPANNARSRRRTSTSSCESRIHIISTSSQFKNPKSRFRARARMTVL